MNARTKDMNAGDRVTWNTSRGRTEGVVKKRLTKPARIKKHKVSASKEKPEFLVESSKSGKKAAHKREALTKVKK